MATTKYGLQLVEFGLTGWNGVLATSIQQVENVLHTYLRYRVASGESIPPKRPVCIQDGQWKMAKDTLAGMSGESTQRLPVVGISIESLTKGSGEWLRAQRTGPVSHSSGETAWSWSPTSGEIWINNSGELVQGLSGENWMNRQARVGAVVNATIIFIQL